ncbi:MAG: PD-(D/E)XK nuclease-like domain-containing protein [Planctomycetota bacterium]
MIDVGLHPQLDPETYYGLPFASNSRLSLLKKSPLHLRHALDAGDFDTEALRFGRDAHVCILEPHRFDDEYAIGPDVKLNTGAGKEAWAQFESENEGKTLVRGGPGADMLAMRRAVLAHPMANTLLSGSGANELSLIWDDPTTGVRCKARADRFTAAAGVASFVDLKGVRDASPYGMSKAVAQYGWHRQAAMYIDGAFAIEPANRWYIIIAVEKTPPYAVGVYEMNEEAIDAGRRERDKLLKLWMQCHERDEWPGYGDGILDLNLPGWAIDNWEKIA